MSSAHPVAVCNGGNTFAAVLTNLSTSIETSRPDSRAAVTLCLKDMVTKWGEGGDVEGETGRALLSEMGTIHCEAA